MFGNNGVPNPYDTQTDRNHIAATAVFVYNSVLYSYDTCYIMMT